MPNVYILPDQRLVECVAGEAILPALLRAGIPFAHACGGRAQCSTCRFAVVEGWAACGLRNEKEQRIADRLEFGPEFRLACQTQVSSDITIRRLVIDEHDAELADIRPRAARRRGAGRRGFGRFFGGRPLPEPVGREVQAAILFSDIRGFTSFADAVLPYDTLHVLQRHLRSVTAVVERHHGIVTSYMGDGVMALFGPEHPETASRRAIWAGLEMLAEADRRRPELDELYGRSFDVNVGVHVGPTIVGSAAGAGAPVTAIGDTVNVASRIEQANKLFGTRFLMSDATLEALGDGVVVGRSFQCELAGKAGEHLLIEVAGLR